MKKLITACLLALVAIANVTAQNYDKNAMRKLQFAEYAISNLYVNKINENKLVEDVLKTGKPVVVLRDTTERPEGVKAGTLKLAGTDEERIFTILDRLLSDNDEYNAMSKAVNPYGDGLASKRIVDSVIERISGGKQ